MSHNTELGIVTLLVAGELAGTAEAAQPSPTATRQDQLQPYPAPIVEMVLPQPQIQARPAPQAMQIAQADPAPTVALSQSDYIGGELLQMNMR